MKLLGIVLGCASHYVPVAEVEALEQRVLTLEKLCANLVSGSNAQYRSVQFIESRIENMERTVFADPYIPTDWERRLKYLQDCSKAAEERYAQYARTLWTQEYAKGFTEKQRLYTLMCKAMNDVADHLNKKPTKQRTVNEAATAASKASWEDKNLELRSTVNQLDSIVRLIECLSAFRTGVPDKGAYIVARARLGIAKSALETHLKTTWEIHYND